MLKEIPSELKDLPLGETVEDCLQIGERLVLYRLVTGKRQATLARELNITRGAVNQWEHGKREPPLLIGMAIMLWLEKYKRYLESSE